MLCRRCHVETETPTKNFILKPDGKVNTTWAVIGSIIIGTGVIVGGLVSVKSDIATAATKAATADDTAKQALEVAREIKEEIRRMRWQIGLDSPVSTSLTAPKKVSQP